MKRRTVRAGTAALDTIIADSFFLRLRGLLSRSLGENEALLLTPCADIHTFFMGYAIDAVFLDGGGRVLKILRDARPNRAFAPVKGARSVLELAAGAARKYDITEGETIVVD